VPNLALIALGDSHHSQGGMKFATQISPLLNSNSKMVYASDGGTVSVYQVRYLEYVWYLDPLYIDCLFATGCCQAQNADQRRSTPYGNRLAALLARAVGLIPRFLLTKDSFKRGWSQRFPLWSDKVSLHSRVVSHDRIPGHCVRKRGYHGSAVISADRSS
jgi:hypothetical protein